MTTPYRSSKLMFLHDDDFRSSHQSILLYFRTLMLNRTLISHLSLSLSLSLSLFPTGHWRLWSRDSQRLSLLSPNTKGPSKAPNLLCACAVLLSLSEKERGLFQHGSG